MTVVAVGLIGCSSKEPADYTYAPVAAYAECTTKVRAGLDPSKVSGEQAAKLVDICDPELQNAAQALAYRRLYESGLEESKKFTATQHLVAERRLLRDVAMCLASTSVSKQDCPRTD